MKSRTVRVCRRALCLVLCVCLCLLGASCHSRATPSRSWTSPKAWCRNGKNKKSPWLCMLHSQGLFLFLIAECGAHIPGSGNQLIVWIDKFGFSCNFL